MANLHQTEVISYTRSCSERLQMSVVHCKFQPSWGQTLVAEANSTSTQFRLCIMPLWFAFIVEIITSEKLHNYNVFASECLKSTSVLVWYFGSLYLLSQPKIVTKILPDKVICWLETQLQFVSSAAMHAGHKVHLLKEIIPPNTTKENK